MFESMINKLENCIIEAQLRESGWRFVKIRSKKIVIDKYKNNTSW